VKTYLEYSAIAGFVALTSLAFTSASRADAPAPGAQDIVTRVIDADPWGMGGAVVTAHAQLKDKHGITSELAFSGRSRRHDGPLSKSIVRFTAPADLAGAGFLHVGFDRFQLGFTAHCLCTRAAVANGNRAVDVGRNRVTKARDPVEGLDVVDGRAGVKLETDQELRVLFRREFREGRPVRLDRRLPLPIGDALEVGKPASARKVRGSISWCAGWAARKGDDTIDSQFGGQPDRVAQVGVVLFRDRLVGVQRIAPRVQRADAQAAAGDFLEPHVSRSGILQQGGRVAVRCRSIAAAADFELSDGRLISHQPIHDLDQGTVRHRFRHNPDAWTAVTCAHDERNCVPIAPLSASAHSATADPAASTQPR